MNAQHARLTTLFFAMPALLLVAACGGNQPAA
jgi:hypothetical protein